MTEIVLMGRGILSVKAPAGASIPRPGPPIPGGDSPDNLPLTLPHVTPFPQVSTAFGGGHSQDARRTDAGLTLASKACDQRRRLASSSAAWEFGPGLCAIVAVASWMSSSSVR
jgi:hypothetical protein